MFVGELVDTDVATDTSGLQGFLGAGTSDAEDVGEGDLQALSRGRSTPMRRAIRRLPFNNQVGVPAREGVWRDASPCRLAWAPAFVRGWLPELGSDRCYHV
jgi:hypothetical protein